MKNLKRVYLFLLTAGLILLVCGCIAKAQGFGITENDFKGMLEFASQVSLKEGLVKTDSAGFYIPVEITEDQAQSLYDKYYNDYLDLYAFNSRDAYLGALYSSLSGIGLGLLESHAFGYKYPGLDQDGWLQNYLTMYTGGDYLIKFYHPNKVGRGMNDIFDRRAYVKWTKFFGSKWYWTYIVHFMLKNSVASIYRGWAKYDKPFYYYEIDVDFDWIVWRLVGD